MRPDMLSWTLAVLVGISSATAPPPLKDSEPTPAAFGMSDGQNVVQDESTACEWKSIRHGTTVVCAPAHDTSSNPVGSVCGTIYSATTGCNLTPINTTQTLTASTMVVRCDQDTCDGAGCAYTPPEPGLDDSCIGCVTVNGTARATQSTGSPVPATASTYPMHQPSTQLPADVPNMTTHGLVGRTLLDPSYYADYDTFMIAELKAAEADGGLLARRPRETKGRSSALIRSFGSRPVTMAVAGLRACTAIVVISRRGAWISHHWEVPTFNNKQGGNYVDDDILVGMYTGDDSGWYPGLNQFSVQGEAFSKQLPGDVQNVIKIIIMTPRIDENFWNGAYAPENGFPPYEQRPFMYFPHIWEAQNSLQNVYGVRPEVHTYTPIDGDAAQLEQIENHTARGKLLLQYDPEQVVVPADEQDQTGAEDKLCGQPMAAVQVWIENTGPVYRDTWFAMEDQVNDDNKLPRPQGSKATSTDYSPYVCVARPEQVAAPILSPACELQELKPMDPNSVAILADYLGSYFDSAWPGTYGNATGTSPGWNDDTTAHKSTGSTSPATANATTTCGNALCALSSTKGRLTTLAATSRVTLTSCSLSTIPATTLTSPLALTVTATPVCNCNNGEERGLGMETLVGGDRKIYTYCVAEAGGNSFLLGTSDGPTRISVGPRPSPTAGSITAETCGLYFSEDYTQFFPFGSHELKVKWALVAPGGRQAADTGLLSLDPNEHNFTFTKDTTGLSYDVSAHFPPYDSRKEDSVTMDANGTVIDTAVGLDWLVDHPHDPWCHVGDWYEDKHLRVSVCRWPCGLMGWDSSHDPWYDGWCNMTIDETIPPLPHDLQWYYENDEKGETFPVNLEVSVIDTNGHVHNGPWRRNGTWTEAYVIEPDHSRLLYAITIYVNGWSDRDGDGLSRRDRSTDGWDNADGWWAYDMRYWKHYSPKIFINGGPGVGALYQWYTDDVNPTRPDDPRTVPTVTIPGFPDLYKAIDLPYCDEQDDHNNWVNCEDQDECTARRSLRCHWRC